MKKNILESKFLPKKELLKDYTLKNDYSSEDLKYKIEGAFDQFDDIMDAMGDIAEREMFHDYPEIKSVYNELYKYKVSTPTKELTQLIHSLTKSFNLKGRKLEIFKDEDKINLDFKEIDNRLSKKNRLDKLKILENKEVKKPKNPFEISKPVLKPKNF